MDHRSIASASMSSSKNNKQLQKSGEHQQGSGGATMAMRKGPWTEEEDAQLVWFVRLFGLKRTGKSCRLRWVNYLHPGLRRGRITADEERLILELHAKWGSRWSRIARSLPGRTDNEIKNFWRTRMRKQKALGERQPCNNNKDGKSTAASPSSSTVTTTTTTSFVSGSPNSGSMDTSSSTTTESAHEQEDDEAEVDGASTPATSSHQQQQQQEHCYTMDQLWNEIAAAEAAASYMVADSWGIGGHDALAHQPPLMPSSPVWEFCSDYSLWKIDDEEYYKKMLDAS